MNEKYNYYDTTSEIAKTTPTPIQVVRSMRIARKLCKDYFANLYRIDKDKDNPDRRVWFFRRSEEFDAAFKQYIEDSKVYSTNNIKNMGE